MKKESAPERAVTDVLTPALDALGYCLVLVKRTSGGRYSTLHVMAERLDGKPMTVQDCVTISHEVNRRFDGEGGLLLNSTLEVSSPGEDRPLVRIEDFERFAGRMAVVEIRAAEGAPRRFQGHIARITQKNRNAKIELITSSGAVNLSLRKIAGARLFPSVENCSAKEKRGCKDS